MLFLLTQKMETIVKLTFSGKIVRSEWEFSVNKRDPKIRFHNVFQN